MSIQTRHFPNISPWFCNVTSDATVLIGWPYPNVFYYKVLLSVRNRTDTVQSCWNIKYLRSNADVNFNWVAETLMKASLFSAFWQQLKIYVFSFLIELLSELWHGHSKLIVIKFLFPWHSTQCFQYFLLHIHIGLKQQILQKRPIFFSIICSIMPGFFCVTSFYLLVFTVLQLSASMLIFYLQLPSCISRVVMHLHFTHTVLFPSLFIAPSLNMKSNLQMSCNYPQKSA